LSTSHLVARGADAVWGPGAGAFASAPGYSTWSIVDGTTPAVHTGFSLGRLEPGGSLMAHVHSYEESLWVMSGEVVIQQPGEATQLGPGDYCLFPIGIPHALRNESPSPVQWARMAAPAPRAAYDNDTYLVPALTETAPQTLDVRDPRTRRYGNITPAHMDPGLQTQDKLAVSASMRTALLVYSGITVKMMVDSDLGATQSTMFMVQYDPDGYAGPHDHPLEETYLITEGSVEATFDGTAYVLEAGDVAWAGVGCVHGFRNVGGGVVRWLETQSPSPPNRHTYRYVRDWSYLQDRLSEGAGS
jgi:quercetin dioxygenase-like cupin family protein